VRVAGGPKLIKG